MTEGYVKSSRFPTTLGYIVKMSTLISALHVQQYHISRDTGFSSLASRLLTTHSVLLWNSVGFIEIKW